MTLVSILPFFGWVPCILPYTMRHTGHSCLCVKLFSMHPLQNLCLQLGNTFGLVSLSMHIGHSLSFSDVSPLAAAAPLAFLATLFGSSFQARRVAPSCAAAAYDFVL
ncbi:hypothetical protein NP493_393g03027 [Ridgeia piscesae]|uniref:Transmembrane protein n=1 Tax=Ridgeia piscesae TaxID=27915 RepID=A0AAD9L2I1_RIDPI|nr:hypothetical protein NP493_393g03027 [Ridgeia piscesae]